MSDRTIKLHKVYSTIIQPTHHSYSIAPSPSLTVAYMFLYQIKKQKNLLRVWSLKTKNKMSWENYDVKKNAKISFTPVFFLLINLCWDWHTIKFTAYFQLCINENCLILTQTLHESIHPTQELQRKNEVFFSLQSLQSLLVDNMFLSEGI